MEQDKENSASIIDALIHRLQTGDVNQRREAADRLASFGSGAISATEALVAALTDPGVDGQGYGGWGGAGGSFYYVRGSAVNALAKINPAAAAPLALQVIAELSGERSETHAEFGDDGKLGESIVSYVTFSDETIAAFSQSVSFGDDVESKSQVSKPHF